MEAWMQRWCILWSKIGNKMVTAILEMIGNYWDQPVPPALHKLLVCFSISVFSTV
jgi:hypothetical protein